MKKSGPSTVQGYLDYKKPEISKRSVSVSYLGGPIKKLSENARCPFLDCARKSLNFARKSLNFSDFARKSPKSPRTLGVRFLIIKKRETPKTLCFLCRTFLIVEVPLYMQRACQNHLQCCHRFRICAATCMGLVILSCGSDSRLWRGGACRDAGFPHVFL